MQKKKFIQSFRTKKMIQLIALLVLELAYVVTLTISPALGTKLYENPTIFLLSMLSWMLAIYNLAWLLYDFYKLRTFAEESHALNRAAYLDDLTGIPNRHGMDVALETYESPEMLARCACFMVTISNLVEVNSRLGHNVGDVMLKDFSVILENVGDRYGIVGRNGGNEFMMLMNDGTPAHMDKFLEELKGQLCEYNEEHSNAPLLIRYSYVLNSDLHAEYFPQLLTATYNRLHGNP